MPPPAVEKHLNTSQHITQNSSTTFSHILYRTHCYLTMEDNGMPTLHLPHLQPIAHGRLTLPPDFMFRPFVHNEFEVPSVQHAIALSNVRDQLEPIAGVTACRKIIDYTIRQHLTAIVGPAPPFGKYCEHPGAHTRAVYLRDGKKNSEVEDLGLYYAVVRSSLSGLILYLITIQCFHPRGKNGSYHDNHDLTDPIPMVDLYSDPNLWALLCTRVSLRPKPTKKKPKKLLSPSHVSTLSGSPPHLRPGPIDCKLTTCPKYQLPTPSPVRVFPTSISPITYRSRASARRRAGPGISNSAVSSSHNLISTASSSLSSNQNSYSSSSIQTPASTSTSLSRTSDPRLRKFTRPFRPGVCPSASPPSPGSAVLQHDSDSSDSDSWLFPSHKTTAATKVTPAKKESE